MAKGQMKSGREAKKPKKSAVAASPSAMGTTPASKSSSSSYSQMYSKKK